MKRKLGQEQPSGFFIQSLSFQTPVTMTPILQRFSSSLSQDLRWLVEILLGKKINTQGFWKTPALKLIYKQYQIRILDPYITSEAAFQMLRFPRVFPKDQVCIYHPTVLH